MFKKIRVLILLMVLLVVAVNSFYDSRQDWTSPVYVALVPINADGSAVTQRYIDSLKDSDFEPINRHLQAQGQAYGQSVRMYYRLGRQEATMPPPTPQDGSITSAFIWSLKFRYYAYRHRPEMAVKPALTLFLPYYDPSNKILTHTSTALQNGRIGVVHLFASSDKTANNNVVIAHESLHGFGASDKYDLATGQPIYPIGYAEPNKSPRYPQTHAELMAMHFPTSPTTHVMARTLVETVIGQVTAIEIGWQK